MIGISKYWPYSSWGTCVSESLTVAITALSLITGSEGSSGERGISAEPEDIGFWQQPTTAHFLPVFCIRVSACCTFPLCTQWQEAIIGIKNFVGITLREEVVGIITTENLQMVIFWALWNVLCSASENLFVKTINDFVYYTTLCCDIINVIMM